MCLIFATFVLILVTRHGGDDKIANTSFENRTPVASNAGVIVGGQYALTVNLFENPNCSELVNDEPTLFKIRAETLHPNSVRSYQYTCKIRTAVRLTSQSCSTHPVVAFVNISAVLSK